MATFVVVVVVVVLVVQRVRKKWNHSIFASNFAKCWPIFEILSPTDLAVNF